MSPQDNSSFSRTLFDAFNKHDINTMLPLIADNVDWLDVPMNVHYKGKQGVQQFTQNWWKAFPDSKVEIKNMIAFGDYVVTEFIGRGTHQGPFMAMGRQIPATQKRLELSFCEVSQFRDGKLISSHTYYDVWSMIRQLGLEQQIQKMAA